ncbi:MAG: crossover junction endodeoxyribonuclease RuvC [Candidatus Levybacteria bacterium RIFCSPLOWO2_01_FULL_39_10]|nr:MAG: crossover junction endodeoxyribonuclease RuvC [Candidatus Levybacteria bacterium RIFCSPLOWO2_01_FULL_39_10]
MRILGVDPGIGRTGWGIIDIENSKLKIVNCGCIETRAGTKVENRLLTISLEIESLIKEYKPDVLSIEELFFSTNAKTAFIVGQARGVVLLLAAKNKLEVSIYTPLQVKMALTGYGRADKNQIAQMVKVILKLEKIPKIDDTSDALAVAITHAFSAKLKNLNIRN